jgi:hypothetical protein
MTTSQELGKKAGIVPFLQLAEQIKDEEGNKKGVKGTGPHQVVFVADKNVKGKDYTTGKERFEVEYTFEENGENKKYRVPTKNENGEFHYFIARMMEFNYGDELVLEYKKIKGSFRGYIDVKKAGAVEEEVFNESGDIIPDKPENISDTPNIDEGEVRVEDIPF